jgi:hypothetical protein
VAKEKYIKRHDRVCAQLHFNICKETGVKLDNKHLYDNVPISVKQVMKVRLPYYKTNRTIPNNKPDIIIWDNKQGTCMLLNVAIPGDRNVIKIKAENIFKYKDLIIEIPHMWKVKAKLMPIITEATGAISKSDNT